MGPQYLGPQCLGPQCLGLCHGSSRQGIVECQSSSQCLGCV